MRNIFFTLVLATVIFASCNNKNTSNNTDVKPLVVAAESATIKYQCPMKCQGDTAYTTVGKCPVCEMDLEKLN